MYQADVTEIIAKRFDVGVPAAENQPFIGLQARHVRQSELRKIEALRKVLVERGRHQAARPLIGPAVIRANKMPGVT